MVTVERKEEGESAPHAPARGVVLCEFLAKGVVSSTQEKVVNWDNLIGPDLSTCQQLKLSTCRNFMEGLGIVK